MALTYSKENLIGTKAPDFNLPGVDGKHYSLKGLLHNQHGVVVMFICNHCPYVVAHQDRLIALAHTYQKNGFQFVGINSNDETNYPDDSFDNMVKVAKQKDYPFPYLRDKDQTAAKAYDAVCTPEIYLVDYEGKIRYHGGIDDNWKEPDKATKHYLKNAIEDIHAGRPVKEPTPHAMGCSIKWAA
ncbi:MAG: thioredoxin family protein [Deltaproteobacteria bacterium]|nr:thioredoxin family protein [Deltaproteobacteria bacterium]